MKLLQKTKNTKGNYSKSLILFFILAWNLKEVRAIAALTKRIEFEIRLRFERGEDLNKLAIIYKVPLSTIKKRKKKSELKGDPWLKHSKVQSEYKSFVELDEQRRKELRHKINTSANKEMNVLQEMVDNAYSSSNVLVFKELEQALNIRSDRIYKFLNLKKQINDIPTLQEEAEFERTKLEIELKKLEIKEKQSDVKLKELETKLILGDVDDL